MSLRAIWRVLLGVGILLTSLLTTIQAVDTAPMLPIPSSKTPIAWSFPIVAD